MEQNTNQILLDMIPQPVFCVRDGYITQCNQTAEKMQLSPGTDVRKLITDYPAYAAFENGALFLQLSIAGIPTGASVTKIGDTELFSLELPDDNDRLQALGLAAQQLRTPLCNVMALTDQLLSPNAGNITPDTTRSYAGQINKGLFQLLRLVSNMADAQHYIGNEPIRMESVNITSLFDELAESATDLLANSSITFRYTGLEEPAFSLVSRDLLERAIYHLISNAVKFSPKDACIEASLCRSGDQLRFTIQNPGTGIAQEVQSSVFSRYTRQPGIEDGRHGLGIGMALVRQAAATHGGTVLIDQPTPNSTRISMTICMRQDPTTTIRTPVILVSDYAGGRSHGLLELAEVLNSDLFQSF